jgi:hypothetical protein
VNRVMNFFFHKMRGFSRLAKEPLASQERLSSMELVVINSPTGLEQDLLMTNEFSQNVNCYFIQTSYHDDNAGFNLPL